MPDNSIMRTLFSANEHRITSFAGCSNSRPAASTYVTPVAVFLSLARLMRRTCDCVRSVKFLSFNSTGNRIVCGDDFA